MTILTTRETAAHRRKRDKERVRISDRRGLAVAVAGTREE